MASINVASGPGLDRWGNLRSNYRQDHIEDDEQYETDKTFNLLLSEEWWSIPIPQGKQV